MQVKILGCSGGIGAGLRTTSILIDDDILIDTGTGIGDLDQQAMQSIKHVFVTHSHLDHTAGLPLLIDSVFEARLDDPLQVHARRETLTAIREHIFNWILWPDFTMLPTAEQPVLQLNDLAVGALRDIGGRKLTSFDVNHTVPGLGFIVESEGKVFAFSGDTASNETLWAALNALPRLDLLVIETAFGNRNEELAWLARHYCPRTLASDLKKLKHDPDIWITHLKPGAEDQIFSEIEEAIPERRVHRLMGGETFNF
ncbi:MAG: 3',5'-cyclic-nucleotide phosphodiesterase [Gammaproteobacteria bacterium]|nr:3',5'-cyclic-nucleotide phosphodiesterase [Gammaproteobacteria bacterium]